MPGPGRSSPRGVSPSSGGPLAVPCLMIRHGRVVVPAEGGPEPARNLEGGYVDLFDVLDRLAEQYPRLYVVDLDAVERDQPQLDYLQEIARDTEVWLDAGVRTADEAIDALVTGASRVVITSSLVESPKTLSRAWKLSQEIVFELELREGAVDTRAPEWESLTPEAVASAARTVGIPDVIVSNREGLIDGHLIEAIARTGPTWVGGSFDLAQLSTIALWGAAGGIFHLTESFYAPSSDPRADGPRSSGSSDRRDDET